MLNKNKQRELAYLVTIDDIKPIPGKDRVECAIVGGWTCMVPKSQFYPGDIGIYFEVDSKLPEKKPFLFLASKHFKIKTQKYKTEDGYFWSQGLLMHPFDFGWTMHTHNCCVSTPEGKIYHLNDESRFLTADLGVVYASAEDNKRKGLATADKYKKMAQRHGKLFSHQPFKWLMKRKWGKQLLFIFFGRKKDKRKWPNWVVKTDEERIENLPFMFKNKDPWIATEKIDGTSTTFTIKRKSIGYDFYVCSRNVVFEKPNQPCFYNTNVYLEMAQKYDIENKLKDLLYNHFPDAKWVTIQGETYGSGVQKRGYSLEGHDFAAFNLITSNQGRFNSIQMVDILKNHLNIPCVPIVKEEYVLPDTIEELREFVDSETSQLDGKMREGIVFRSLDGSNSFKCVSPNYLIKYHNG